MWHGKADNWVDPSCFGDLILVSEQAPWRWDINNSFVLN
jgi:hypothetical protein